MLFKYKAKNAQGKEKSGELEAETQLELARILRKDGFYLIEIKAQGEKSGGSFLKKISTFDLKRVIEKIKGVSLEEKMMFSHNLSVMISSGIAFTRALSVLEKQTQSYKFKEVLRDLSQAITKGKNFSDAVSEHPKTFNKLFSSMIRAGEVAGNLDKSLDLLANQMEKEHELKSRVKGALIYPAVIIIAMIGIGILMMVTVVPQLKATFEDLGVDLPLTTQFIILLSDFLQVYWWLVIISLPAAAFGFKKAIATPVGKKFFSLFLLRMPVIKGLTLKINNANFSRTLSSLIEGGVPILQALKITSDVVGNEFYKKSILESSDAVKKGDNLYAALQRYPKLYTPLLLEMVEVGEEAGKLSELLVRVAEFYEGEVSDTTKNLSSIIEPVLMIVIGGVVGFFAVSVMQPIYGIVGNI